MYNKQHYNRGKYNVSVVGQEVSGRANIHVDALNAHGGLLVSPPQSPLSAAGIVISAIGRQTSALYAPVSVADIAVNGQGDWVRAVFGVEEYDEGETPPSVILDANGEQSVGVFAPVSAGDVSISTTGEGSRTLFPASPTAPSTAVVVLFGNGSPSREVFGETPASEIGISTSGEGTREISGLGADGGSSNADITLDGKGAADIYGYAVISLGDLALPPNGDLVIDTGEMTVTLNGVDVTRYFSADSEFFKLKPTDNLVVYEDGVLNRNISYKILWKDLFL